MIDKEGKKSTAMVRIEAFGSIRSQRTTSEVSHSNVKKYLENDVEGRAEHIHRGMSYHLVAG